MVLLEQNADTAHEIRDGHITREEGINLVKRFDGEFPNEYFDVFLKYCDISADYFHEIIDSLEITSLMKKG